MDLYHSTDMDGVSILNPDAATLRELLAQLNSPAAEEADHPDVTLIHDPSGWAISAYPGGTVTLENLGEADTLPCTMNAIHPEEILELWLELAQGKIELVQQRRWIAAAD